MFGKLAKRSNEEELWWHWDGRKLESRGRGEARTIRREQRRGPVMGWHFLMRWWRSCCRETSLLSFHVSCSVRRYRWRSASVLESPAGRSGCKDSFSLGSASTCPGLVLGGTVLFDFGKHRRRYSAFVAQGSWWRRRTFEIGVEDWHGKVGSLGAAWCQALLRGVANLCLLKALY